MYIYSNEMGFVIFPPAQQAMYIFAVSNQVLSLIKHLGYKLIIVSVYSLRGPSQSLFSVSITSPRGIMDFIRSSPRELAQLYIRKSSWLLHFRFQNR